MRAPRCSKTIKISLRHVGLQVFNGRHFFPAPLRHKLLGLALQAIAKRVLWLHLPAINEGLLIRRLKVSGIVHRISDCGLQRGQARDRSRIALGRPLVAGDFVGDALFKVVNIREAIHVICFAGAFEDCRLFAGQWLLVFALCNPGDKRVCGVPDGRRNNLDASLAEGGVEGAGGLICSPLGSGNAVAKLLADALRRHAIRQRVCLRPCLLRQARDFSLISCLDVGDLGIQDLCRGHSVGTLWRHLAQGLGAGLVLLRALGVHVLFELGGRNLGGLLSLSEADVTRNLGECARGSGDNLARLERRVSVCLLKVARKGGKLFIRKALGDSRPLLGAECRVVEIFQALSELRGGGRECASGHARKRLVSGLRHDIPNG